MRRARSLDRPDRAEGAVIGSPPIAASDPAPAARNRRPARLAFADRIGPVLLALALAAVLGAALRAPILRTGDAHQYHAMAAALARLGPPSLSADEVAAYKAWLAAQPAASSFPDATRAIDQPNLVRDGRQEFSHFWLYPLLASPAVALLTPLGVHPGYAFLAVNAVVLAIALWQIAATTRPAVALLLLASPLLWFVNKAQVEVFTFGCLALAMTLAIRGRFAWAALAAAVASTQNIPIAAVVPVFWAAGLLRAGRFGSGPRATASWRGCADRTDAAAAPGAQVPGLTQREPAGSRLGRGRGEVSRDGAAAREGRTGAASDFRGRRGGLGADGAPRLEDRRGAIVAVALTLVVMLLHPAYYLWRLGVVTPQQLNGGIGPNVPSVERFLAVLVDPDVGLLAWAPQLGVLALVGAVLLAKGRAKDERLAPLRWPAAVGAVGGGWFLLAFAQTTNVNSGGTVHLSRYALWLLPLLIPFLAAVAVRPRANAAMLALGAVALPVYAILFDPAQPERYVVPSPQSAWLNDALPGVYRPVPEVFYERRRAVDGGVRGSVATPSCRVILVAAVSREQPCPLTAAEVAAVDRLLASGWGAVWVTRPGAWGLGRAGVSGALPPP